MSTTTAAYAVNSAHDSFAPLAIQRRDVGDFDVAIDVLFCGVCHSDLHTARAEWEGTKFPCVPGHEIVGRVAAVGAKVSKFKKGELVGVGCMVDSCQHCVSCASDEEQYCENGFVGTYNGATPDAPGHTLGGYSQAIVVTQKFVLKITHPEEQLAAVAPLLCAGITLYSPLHHWGAGPGKKVGIVGLGGLGHMGVKIAHAMGAKVVLFTTSASKIEDGKKLGADEVVISKDADAMAAQAGTLDLIVNTVAAPHDLDPFINALKRDGTMVLVGAPATSHPSPQIFNLIFKRRSLAGSLIGGIKETQDMLDFCARHQLVAEIEMITAADIDKSYERMLKGDVKYRFVIDSATLG
jgi:uncharacterized zinc-type alcohol dehydrogenase-like protein